MSYNHPKEKGLRKAIKSYFGTKLQGVDLGRLEALKFPKPKLPQKFYEDLGLLVHDRTHKLVKKLAFYQDQFWEWMFYYKYRLAVKAQKVGLTTSVLMENFQQAVLPPSEPESTMGYETLVIAQNEKIVKDHLNSIYKQIKQSKKYSGFLIEKPRSYLRPTDVTKTTEILLENPYNPIQPSRIIGLGSNPGSVWSHKRVKKIHMSDPAAINKVDDTELYDAAFSRLAITNGYFVIESPPRGQRGQLWEIYKASKLRMLEEGQIESYADFKIMEIPYTHAIEAKVFDKAFFDREKNRLGPRFGQYYECEFLNPSNTWYDDSLFAYDSTLQLDE